MTTVLQCMDLAFRDSGVFGAGQTPLTTDRDDALLRMNLQISQWNRRRWLIYGLVDTACACDGSVSYTVGPAGDFNIARPDQIEAAYIRQTVPTQPSPIDWPLQVIMSREEYSQISIKTLTAAPSEAVWYDSAFPTGLLYPWPVPNNQYELHILTKTVIARFATTGDTIQLPPEYEALIYLTFVNQMRAAYRMPPDAYYIGQQKAALNTIRKANFQVGRLSLPRGIMEPGAAYNIFSDR